MRRESKWEGVAARVYYTLGGAYYVKEWIWATGIGGCVLSFFARRVTSIGAVMVGMGSTALLGWAVALWIISVRTRLSGPNPSLRVFEVDESLELMGEDRFISRRTLKAQARSAGADHYKDLFQWSGKGEIVAEALMPLGATIRLEKDRQGPMTVARLSFPRALARKEMVEASFALHLIDRSKAFQPHLGVVFTDFCRKVLTMSVRFSVDRPSSFKRSIFLSDTAEIPIFEEEIDLRPGSDEVSWVIPRPRPHYRYLLSW